MEIRIQGVTQTFAGKKKPALEEVRLTLESGRTHVLLGSSGSGKSTLIRVIAGLIAPDRGEVWIGDERMRPETQRQLAPRIGYVIQEGGLFPHLSAWDNVALPARMQGWKADRLKARIDTLAELVGLGRESLKRDPAQLSGGQRQRIALMRALVLAPPVLLLDEPLGSLDPLIRAGLQRELRAIFKRLGVTVVFVTHDVSEAAFFGDTITLFHEGRIEQHGSLEDLALRPARPFVTDFLHALEPPPEMEVLRRRQEGPA